MLGAAHAVCSANSDVAIVTVTVNPAMRREVFKTASSLWLRHHSSR
jgi:hypothetical protein